MSVEAQGEGISSIAHRTLTHLLQLLYFNLLRRTDAEHIAIAIAAWAPRTFLYLTTVRSYVVRSSSTTPALLSLAALAVK